MNYVIRHGRRIEVETLDTDPKRRRTGQHIGCPVPWLKRLYPLVESKQQLVIGLWLYRRSTVCGGGWFTVPNAELLRDLGLSRHTKYRAMGGLEKAGVVKLSRKSPRRVLVRLCW
jgi:hypothetical protein